MSLKNIDIVFKNYCKQMAEKVEFFLLNDGYEKHSSGDNLIYSKNGKEICVCEHSYYGENLYINFETDDISGIMRSLSECPQCGSKRLRPMIFRSWKSDHIDRLIKEGIIVCRPGCVAIGNVVETRRCLDCNCRWHNKADMYYWNELYKANGDISDEELGIDYLKN